MKVRIFIFSALISLSLLKGQNLVQGSPFDSTLYHGYYTTFSGCTQNSQMTIKLDTALYHYPGGMQFMMVVDSISFPGPVFVSPVQPGDTILLNSAAPLYGTPPFTGINFWFRIVLAGTPTTANQPYPCHIGVNTCTCFCLNLYIEPSPFNTSVCRVDLANAIAENKITHTLNLYPNPSNTGFTVKGLRGKNALKLYDSFGRLVLEQETHEDAAALDTWLLPEGVYNLCVNGCDGRSQHKVMVKH